MKIALTGGPSAGKTALAETIALAMTNRLTLVQEAASLLFRSGFPRAADNAHLLVQQRAIYHVQTALEDMAILDRPGRPLLCDRGTLDGLAYWPGPERVYFETVGSSMEKELSRYDWVIHVDLAPPLDLRRSRFRIESEAEILYLNERIKLAWRLHPRRLIVPATLGFVEKIELTTQAVQKMLAGTTPLRSSDLHDLSH